MLQLMVRRWGMSEAFGKEFSYFGENIGTCSKAVKELASKGSAFEPCLGLPACSAGPGAKKHVQNMVEQAWSPVCNLKLDAASWWRRSEEGKAFRPTQNYVDWRA